MSTSATANAGGSHPRRHRGFDFSFSRFRGLVTAIVVFAILLLIVDLISAGPLSYFDISFLSSGGATLALAAIGETIVILSGGFDLSAGAVLSLVNVVLATTMDPTNFEASILLWTFIGIGIGMLVGAFNGFFIAFLRLQPIVVTLSTMFIVQGVTLLFLDKPGGFVSPSLGGFYLGDAIPNLVPMPIVLLVVVGFFWLWMKRTRFGTALYAIGSDPNAAASAGVARSTGRALPSTWWPAASTGSAACSSAPRPVPAIRSSAIRCCCRSSPPWWSAAPGSAVAAAGRSARCSAPTS